MKRIIETLFFLSLETGNLQLRNFLNKMFRKGMLGISNKLGGELNSID